MSSSKKRIVVTGMGIVSCFGNDIDQFYEHLLQGKSGIVPIEEFPVADYPTRFAGCIRNFDPGVYMDKKQARRVDPFIRYVIVSGKKALESAKLDADAMAKLDKTRCGVIIGSAEKMEPVRKSRGLLGTVNAPHNFYLLLRGLKTLELRMQRHNENGLAVAQFLEAHPRIEKVYYPGLPSHAYYEVAKRTMRGFGGLLTFVVKDADLRKTADIVDAVRLPRIGPSLGGVESIIEQSCLMSYHDYTPEQREAVGIYDNMIRLSCGIENAEDLIADLAQALEA